MTDLRDWLDERTPEAGGLERLERALEEPSGMPGKWWVPVACAVVALLMVTVTLWPRPTGTDRLEAALREVLIPEPPEGVRVEGHRVTEHIDARNNVRVVVVVREADGGEEMDRG